MPVSLFEGVLMALAAAVLLVGGRALVALASGEDPRDALEITGRWSAGLIGAAGAAGAMGLVELADAIGMLTMFVGSHPFAVGNGVTISLGALVAGGWLDLSAGQFVGVAIAAVGAVMLLYEVDS